MVFAKSTFFATKDLHTGAKRLQSKVFSAGVAGIDNIRGTIHERTVDPSLINYIMLNTNTDLFEVDLYLTVEL